MSEETNTPNTLQDLKENAKHSLMNDFDVDDGDYGDFINEAANNAVPDIYWELLQLCANDSDIYLGTCEQGLLSDEVTPIDLIRTIIYEEVSNYLNEHVNELMENN